MKENKRRPLRLKGVVLVMVVTLLFILVVMLMATLTVVGNANKRTVTKFEENQAYYTARSALGVYITGMLEMDETADLNADGARRAGTALGNKFNDVSGSELAIFYKNKTNSNDGYANFGGNPIVEGFVYQQEIFGYLKPKYRLKNDIKQYDRTKDVSDEANAHSVLTTTSNDDDWVENEHADNNYFIKYKVKVPDVNSVTGMSSDGSVGVMATEDVDVTVELLRMVYLTKDDLVVTDGAMDQSKAYIADVDWSKTYYRVKVTSTAKIKQGTGGVNEGTVSVILEPKVVNSPSAFKNALTTFEGTDINVKGFTIGGASASATTPVGSGSTYQANNNSTWVGSYVYRYDDVMTNTGGFSWKLFEEDTFVIQGGSIGITNFDKIDGMGDVNATSQEELDKRPYIYAGGFSFVNNPSFKIGDTDKAVDLVLYHNKYFSTKYNTYASRTNGKGDPARIAYVDGDQYGNFHDHNVDVYGDIYCDGDMYVNGKTKFHGNVFCTGNIFIRANGSEKPTFDKKAVLGGALYKDDGTEITDMVGNITLNDSNLQSMRDSDSNEDHSACPWGNVWDQDDGHNDKINAVPEIGFGGLTARSDGKKISTVETITETYRDSSKNIIPASEFIKMQTKQDKMKLTVKNNAPIFVPQHTPTVPKTFTIDGETFTQNVIDPTDPSIATFNSETSFYEMKMDLGRNDMMNTSGTYFLDATGGNIQIQLTGKQNNISSNFELVVIGDNDVIFSTDDCASETEVWFKGSILSYDIWKMTDSTKEVFNLGEIPDNNGDGQPDLKAPKPPKIYYYLGKNTKFSVDQSSNGMRWAGYMYGPEASFKSGSAIGVEVDYTYDGQGKTSPSDPFKQGSIFCFGSMVFQSIDSSGGDLGILFIDPGSDPTGAPATDKVIWTRQRYLNR